MTSASNRFSALRSWVALILIGSGCATPSRTVPPALDPANPDAEEQSAAAQLTPLVPPGPPEPGASGVGDSMTGSAHAGHGMAGMKMSGDNGTEKALPPAGHDMAGMKTSKPSAEKAAPSAGHDMAEMKSSELGADKASPSGHDMTGMKKAEPDAKASPGSHDMAEMKKSGDKSVAPDEEEHLMGVVTRVDGTALTVILEKGSSAIILTDKQTVFERGEAKATLKGIKTGERLVVYATPKDGKWLARMVKLSAPPAAEAKGADVGDAGSSTQHDGMKMPDAKNTQPAQEFTCPMHPEVRSPTPGKCPKCGMKLQPVGSK